MKTELNPTFTYSEIFLTSKRLNFSALILELPLFQIFVIFGAFLQGLTSEFFATTTPLNGR